MQIRINFYINGKHIVLISIFDLGFNACLYTAILLAVLAALTLLHSIFTQQMNKVYKKAFSSLVAIFFISISMFAQQNHFVYLQTENKQPFYIKLDNKIFSSSASGYVIIPKLQDGAYALTIGFPKNEWPEQNVSCNVNKKDAGYLLKDFGEKGWGLFNLQTMEVVMSGSKPAVKTAALDNTKTDIFSNTLSNVVNDPSIIKKAEEKPAVKEEVKSVEAPPQKEMLSTQSLAVVNDSSVSNNKAEKPLVKEEVKPASEAFKKDELATQVLVRITKLLSTKTAEGTEMIYIDMEGGSADTIRLFIPEEKKELVTQLNKEDSQIIVRIPAKEEIKKEEVKKEEVNTGENKQQVPQASEVNKPETKNNDPKFIDIELPNPNAKKDTIAIQVKPVITDSVKIIPEKQAIEKPKEVIAKPAIGNSDCKSFATEDDFLKLRKKMAAENNDDDMVNVAKKVFRSRCFTTEQVKNLSVLFLKDEGKYKFFDTAYPFVSDSFNFNTLEAQLNDNYFITRFKAMIRH